MLFNFYRVFKDTGTFTDLSLDNQDESANVSLSSLTSSQYIYIAQKLPFTNIFVWIHTQNNQDANLVIEYWDGSSWRAAVDILDGTKSGNHTLSKSGNISFSLAYNYNWFRLPNTEFTSAPTELQSLRILDCYWLRIRPTATLANNASVREFTYSFTHTQELNNFDVEINNYFAAFETGKDNWIPEIIAASKLLVLDLKRMGLIVHPGQIVEFDDVSVPATLKTLELIYMQLGPSYTERKKEIRQLYTEALNSRRLSFDSNADGKVEVSERFNQVKRLVR